MEQEICNDRCKVCGSKPVPTCILNNEELEILCKNSISISYQKGERILKQGSFTKNIVFIKSGIIKTHMNGPFNRDEILNIDKGPKYVGLPDLFVNKIHSYSVTALSDTDTCFIDAPGFNYLIKSNSDFAVEMMKNLSNNLTNHFKKCVNKIQKQLTASLAEALLYFSDYIFEYDEFILPLTRSEFGAYIGTTRESVTKIIHDLVKDQIIDAEGKNIKILKKDILKKISYPGNNDTNNNGH